MPLPSSVKDLLEVSSFVGHTPDSHKLNWRTKTYTYSGSWLGSLFRRFYGESSVYTAQQVERISSRLVEAISESKGKEWEIYIQQNAEKFVEGANILAETYKDSVEIETTIKLCALNVEDALKVSRL